MNINKQVYRVYAGMHSCVCFLAYLLSKNNMYSNNNSSYTSNIYINYVFNSL